MKTVKCQRCGEWIYTADPQPTCAECRNRRGDAAIVIAVALMGFALTLVTGCAFILVRVSDNGDRFAIRDNVADVSARLESAGSALPGAVTVDPEHRGDDPPTTSGVSDKASRADHPSEAVQR